MQRTTVQPVAPQPVAMSLTPLEQLAHSTVMAFAWSWMCRSEPHSARLFPVLEIASFWMPLMEWSGRTHRHTAPRIA
jgi:hypothetical protein